MTTYHVLNGDVLKEKLQKTGISGEKIVCREALIEGPTVFETPDQFWDMRSKFINRVYDVSIDDYFKHSVNEFTKILNVTDNTEINLWFEDDLFCQVNMWFVLSIISKLKTNLNVYRIFPVIKNKKDTWKGFGLSDEKMLQESLEDRVKFEAKDIQVVNELWKAYSSNDLKSLEVLSHSDSNCFQHLQEVCKAQIERISDGNDLGRPETVLKEIISYGVTDFNEIFKLFSEREGIYGFGDLQVKNVYDRLMASVNHKLP